MWKNGTEVGYKLRFLEINDQFSKSLAAKKSKSTVISMFRRAERDSGSSVITNLVSVFSINFERFPNGVSISQFFSSRSNLNKVVSGSVDKFLKRNKYTRMCSFHTGCVRHILLPAESAKGQSVGCRPAIPALGRRTQEQ